jgi:hypothetical protein
VLAKCAKKSTRKWVPKELIQPHKKLLQPTKSNPANKQHHHKKSSEQRVPQGSCQGPGMWNIFYNSLLNLTFVSGTKTVAFADDLLLLTRGKTVSDVENIANIELKKVSRWAKESKIRFNDQKSKVMLMTRRKRKERKKGSGSIFKQQTPQRS